jgi:putative tryptophan/tyrosine transport system permease protein
MPLLTHRPPIGRPQRFRSASRRALAPLLSLAFAACGSSSGNDRPVIGFAQVSSVGPLDNARAGFFRALSDSGFVDGQTITVVERNAQGDIPTLTLIMNEFLQRRVTHVATVASVTTQAALKVITDRPHVFGAVANPYIIGAGTTPSAHRANVTGAEIPLPVDSALALALEAFPGRTVWGTLFDPSDPFAEFYMEMVSRTAKALGVRFVSVACTNPGEILAGVQTLRAQGAQGILQIPSVMIGGGFPALVKGARQLGLPVVASTSGLEGAPMSLGLSFDANGYDMGLLMIRVLRGESPATIPFQAASRRLLVVDVGAVRDLGFTVPEAILARADTVRDGTTLITARGAAAAPTAVGTATNAAPASAPAASAPAVKTAALSAVAPAARLGEWGFWIAALAQGLAYIALAWGVYMSSRVLRFADISPDGTFPLGAAVAAALIFSGTDPLVATFAALVAGMVVGYVTGVLHTRLGVTDLLSGILVMTALYSVNLHVMGRSNVSLLDRPTIATRLHAWVPGSAAWPDDVTFGLMFLAIAVALGLIVTWFLRTDFGMAMRAVGDNPAMITAQGVDRRGMVELGLAIANGLVAFSGALIAQYQGFADVGMGVGTMVAGMAAVILGETLRPRRWRLGATILMVALGAIAFRTLIALALRVGLNPIDLKLATAAFVLAALALPRLGLGRRFRRSAS